MSSGPTDDALSDAVPLRYHDPAQAWRLTHAAMTGVDPEWWLALLLRADHTIACVVPIWTGSRCEVSPTPVGLVADLLRCAETCQARYAIGVRYHGEHRWAGPSVAGVQRFRAFRQALRVGGVLLHEQIIGDATGIVWTMRPPAHQSGDS